MPCADYALRSFAVALIAIPSFWLGLIAIRFDYLWDDPLVNLQILWVPTLIPGLSQLPGGRTV